MPVNALFDVTPRPTWPRPQMPAESITLDVLF
jgi:hypothetical protein